MFITCRWFSRFERIASVFKSKVSLVRRYATHLSSLNIFLGSGIFFSVANICGFLVLSRSYKLKFPSWYSLYRLNMIVQCRQSALCKSYFFLALVPQNYPFAILWSECHTHTLHNHCKLSPPTCCSFLRYKVVCVILQNFPIEDSYTMKVQQEHLCLYPE